MSYGRLEVNLVALAKIKRPIITIMKITLVIQKGWSISEIPFRPFLSVRWAGCVAWGSIVGCCHTCKCPGRPRRDTPTPNMSRLAAEHKSTFVQCIVHETMSVCSGALPVVKKLPVVDKTLPPKFSTTLSHLSYFYTTLRDMFMCRHS